MFTFLKGVAATIGVVYFAGLYGGVLLCVGAVTVGNCLLFDRAAAY